MSESSDTTSFARTLATVAIEKLATDVQVLDLREIVSYTDYFVVCTGSNSRQTKAIADHVIDRMREMGHKKPRRRESDLEGSWVLLDYVDVVVHVFTPESREFYRLDSLWGQVPQETITDASIEDSASTDASGERRTAQA